MCVRVLNNDTKQSTDSPIGLAEMLNIDILQLPVDNAYNQLIPQSCLCQVDIEKACKLAGYSCSTNDDYDFEISKKTQQDFFNETRKAK